MDHERYNSLRSKRMIEILDGDTGFGIIKVANGVNVPIQMPYLTGRDIRKLSEEFGYQVADESTLSARKVLLDDLITYCILNDRSTDLLDKLLSEEQFGNVLAYVDDESKDTAFGILLDELLKQINSALAFDHCTLEKQDGHFVLTGAGSEPKKTVLHTITKDTIKDFVLRAENDLDQGDNISAKNKSVTLIENVFCYAIEKADEVPANSKNVKDLYGQIKKIYPVSSAPLAGSVDTLVSALDATSDVTDSNIARLYVNATVTAAYYVLSLIGKN